MTHRQLYFMAACGLSLYAWMHKTATQIINHKYWQELSFLEPCYILFFFYCFNANWGGGAGRWVAKPLWRLSSVGSQWPLQPAADGNLIRNLTVSSKLLCYNNQRVRGKKSSGLPDMGFPREAGLWAVSGPWHHRQQHRGVLIPLEDREKLVGKPLYHHNNNNCLPHSPSHNANQL